MQFFQRIKEAMQQFKEAYKLGSREEAILLKKDAILDAFCEMDNYPFNTEEYGFRAHVIAILSVYCEERNKKLGGNVNEDADYQHALKLINTFLDEKNIRDSNFKTIEEINNVLEQNLGYRLKSTLKNLMKKKPATQWQISPAWNVSLPKSSGPSMSNTGELKNILNRLKDQRVVPSNSKQNASVSDFLFEERIDNNIQLYSNAYNNPEKNAGAFHDILNAIDNAQETIVIVGWAVSPDETFGQVDGPTLVERLAKKASEGVKVVVLAWDNIAPVYREQRQNFMPYLEAAIKKATHGDEEKAKKAGENIFVKYSPRRVGYTDHQKMVIVDSKVGFIGGLDLTHGRSDPETWHDNHARVEGGCVKDMLELIRARLVGVRKNDKDDKAIEIVRIARNKAHNEAKKIKSPNPPTSGPKPTTRILASIKERRFGAIWSKKERHATEIRDAYVQAIAGAQKFIYIENQFFAGPRYAKGDGQTTIPSANTAVYALRDKIKEKFKAGQPFHVYIQLPYRPEGENPDAVDVQLALRKQWKTMEWLIKEVNKETGGRCEDYLTFYNIGQKNMDYDPNNAKSEDFKMTYTHSKLMIVDDETLIVGSANFNERSMSGKGDSEVAIEMKGQTEQIKDYRTQLMKEHFGKNLDSEIINDPHRHAARIQYVLNHNLNEFKKQECKKPTEPPKEFKQNIRATPWGNITTKQLLKEERRPDYVPNNMPKRFFYLKHHRIGDLGR